MKIILNDGKEFEVMSVGEDRGFLWIRFVVDGLDFYDAVDIFKEKTNISKIIVNNGPYIDDVVYDGYTDLVLVQKEYITKWYNTLIALKLES